MTSNEIIKELRKEIDKILQTGKSLRSYRIYQYLDMLEKHNPPLSECIKEWEILDYELINDYCSDFHFVKKIENTIYNRPIYHHFVIERINGGRYFAYSSFEKDDNFNHRQYFVISFEEHNLISKTLKALEVEDES